MSVTVVEQQMSLLVRAKIFFSSFYNSVATLTLGWTTAQGVPGRGRLFQNIYKRYTVYKSISTAYFHSLFSSDQF